VGETAALRGIRDLAQSVADSRSTVLISGESGTGKELVARSVHYQSRRCQGPFVKINCAALPEGLIESELFGHEKGAFTGAIRGKRGKFELASGGTLLLDEVGEMATPVQAKLLRVLQEREVHKVGGDDPVEVDVRVVATTNRDLTKETAGGRFREDLYYRLNVIRIHLPPLRERKEDIPALVDHFIAKFNNENGFSVEGLAPGGLEILTAYDWPGNIRELENTIERAVVLTRTGTIDPRELNPSRPAPARAENGGGLSVGMTVAQAEKALILKTLDSCGQNRTRAAQMLDISVRTLRNKLNEYGMALSSDSGDPE
jgi:transcriptional regulator with PAS, ATPase and Fis domain